MDQASVSLRVGIASLLLLLPQTSGTTSAGPGSSVTERREAEATWFLPDVSGEYDKIALYIWVRRVSSPGEDPTTRVEAGWAPCNKETENSITCFRGTRIKKLIPNENFKFDETLETARVRFRGLGMKHRITWTGTSTPGRSTIDKDCGPVPVLVARGIGRDADARGSLFGRRLNAADYDGDLGDGYLSIMIYVKTECP